jgi:HEPN domain-containing protein
MKREEIAFLLDLKALMEHAILHQQSGTKLDMRLAINHAHQAVELTLRKKVELLGKSSRYFPGIIKVLKKKGVRIPYERQIDELNEARRLTQHYGTTPNDNDARRLIFVARDFLIYFWKEAFDVNYDDISLIDLVSNEEVKKTLVKAEEAQKAKKYEKAIIKSVLSTYKVRWWIGKKFRRRPQFPFGGQLFLDEVLDFILDIALSGPFAYKLWKLRETTGIVFLPIPGGEPVIQQLTKHKFTRKDSTFALELATEYALWAEQVYG